MRAVLVAVALLATACGAGTTSAADLRACIAKHAAGTPLVSTEAGVTTLIYTHRGAQTIVSVFPSSKDAAAAIEQEARMGDAHDKRRTNVLYDGGGAVEDAVVTCVR